MKLTGGLKLQRVGKITGGFQSSQRGRGGGEHSEGFEVHSMLCL